MVRSSLVLVVFAVACSRAPKPAGLDPLAVSMQPPEDPPPFEEAAPEGGDEAAAAEVVDDTGDHGPGPTLDVAIEWCEGAGCPVVLTFDRDVVATLDAALPEVTLDPPQAGTWAWSAVDTLTFTPGEGALLWGHQVQVTLGRVAPLGDEEAALDGWSEMLYVPQYVVAGKVASWPIEPGKPRFMGFVNAFSMQVGAEPLLLLYDQPVLLDAVKAELRLETPDGKPLGNKVFRPKDVSYVLREEVDPLQLVAVRPADRLTDGASFRIYPPEEPGHDSGASDYLLTVDTTFTFEGFEAERGELGTAEDPLGLSTRLQLTFSNAVQLDELSDRLVVEPTPPGVRVSGWGSSVWLQLDLDPGVAYTVRAPDLRDVLGNKLAAPLVMQLRSEDLPPELTLPAEPTVTESGRARVVGRGRNVGPLTLTASPFADPAAFARAVASDAGTCAERGAGPATQTRPAAAFTLNQLLDERTFSLDPRPGLYCLELSATGLGSEASGVMRSVALLQSTDLGVTAKVSEGAVVAWVTRIGAPAPVAGAAVSVIDADGRPLASGVSDADGIVSLPVDAATASGVSDTIFVVAAQGGDASVTRLAEDRLSRAWQFGLTATTDEPLALDAALFTERGAYRPGEAPHVVVLAGPRRAGQRATVTVDDARGQEVLSKEVTLDRYGAADVSVDLAEQATVGAYQARVAVDGRSTSTSFLVEEYRVPTFEVTVAAPDAWPRGVAVDARVTGRYLHGGTLDGREVRWSVSRAPVSFAPRSFPQYLFRLGDAAELAGVIASGAGRLDGTGQKIAAFTPEHPSSAGPLRYTVEAAVTDVDRQAYSGRSSRVVHPADFYVGVAPPLRAVIAAGDTLEVPVVTVTPDGSALAGVAVRARLERVDHHQTTRVGANDAAQTLNREVPVPSGDCEITSTLTASSCRFAVAEPGLYRVRAWARDTKGRDVQAGFEVTATGDGPTKWPRFDRERVALTADKPVYAPGDVAHLVVQTPFPRALALLTLERDGVLSHRVLQIDGDTPSIDVPITGAHAPNVYASVLLLRGREHDQVDATGFETGAPALRVGYAELAVETAEQRAGVVVATDRPSVGPGDPVTVSVRLTDPSGQPVAGQAAVMVVDEAVLGLTGFQTPDPVASLFPERPLGVRTADGRQELPHARRDRNEVLFPGGDGSDGEGALTGNELRSLFESTAFFDGAVPIAADGTAKVTFDAPDNTTTWRVMAVAVDAAGRGGSGEARFVVKLPLMVQAVLPRFAYPGDRMELGALLFNGTERPGDVDVVFDFDGVVATGSSRSRVTVAADATGTATVPVRFEGVGEAIVRITASMGETSDAIEVRLPIREPGAARKQVVSGPVSGEGTFTVTLPPDTVPGSGRLEVVASTTALTELKDAVGYLMGYPNGCIEQTTSTAYPLVALDDLLPEIGVEVDEAQVRKYAEAGVRRILSFQTEEGGLSYWPGGTEPHAFATAFGLTALIAAKEKDYDVPDEALAGMGDYLEAALRSGGPIPGEMPHGSIADGDTRALFVMTLGRLGRPQPAMVSHLWEQRASLTPFGLSFLGVAASELDPKHPLIPSILAEVARAAEQTPSEAWFEGDRQGGYSMDSPLRTHAAALLAYSVAPSAGNLDARLLTGLLARREYGMWGNTQENVFGIMGVVALTKQGGGASASAPRLTVDGAAIDPSALEVVSRRVRRYSQSGLGAGEHTVWARHEGTPLNLTVRATYDVALNAANRAPVSEGVTVVRDVRAVDGAAVDLADIPLGSLVVVRLQVQTDRALNYVAIDDKLPAGLEPLNTSLATTERVSTGPITDEEARALALLSYTEMRDHRVAFYADELPAGRYTWSYVARATTAGTFLRPAASAEAMYETDVRGASAIDEVTIRAR